MQRVLVLGLQKTGQSVLRFLGQQEEFVLSGYASLISDADREVLAQEFPYVFFYSGELREVLQSNQFDLLVLSPGFSVYLPEIQDFICSGGKITGDIQLWLECIKQPAQKLIAITGSNGKSTVTELVGFLCRQSGLSTVVAGNIGLPILDAHLQLEDKKVDVWVLELSSFQLETISELSADAATCLNVSEDHLDRYKDLLDYAHHKAKIFDGGKLQVLNLDAPLCRAMQRDTLQSIYFSNKQKSDYWCQQESGVLNLMYHHDNLISMQSLRLQGLHNACNVLVALALCESIGVDRQEMLQFLPFFKGLPHRVEKIGEINSISFIDDSKGTNVGATLAALEGAPDEVILIAGGLGKGQDFTPLKSIIEQKVISLFLIGQDAKKIAEIFQNSHVTPIMCDSLQDATRQAYQVASKNSWILLSPACASMDMFRDYTHRSEVFLKTFEEIKIESTQ